MNLPHWLYDAVAGTIVTCSILHSFLPPWDWLTDFPRAQKYYKLLIYLVGYIAINGRSTVYHSISQSQPNVPNIGIGPNDAQRKLP